MSGNVHSLWLAAAILAPLLLAVALLLPMRERLIHLTPWAVLPALAAALGLPDDAGAHYPWLILGLELRLDTTGRGFLLLTALLWLAAGVYVLGYLRAAARRVEYHAWYLLAMAGNIGLVLAADVVGFYVFFTIMSLASYGLVVFERRDEVWRAGRVYIILAVLSEILLLIGLVMHVDARGSLSLHALASEPPDGMALWALIFGLGIKAGLLPLHVWLPLAHPAAPTPASAVLSGAMIKAGLLGWLRLLPVGHDVMPETGLVLIVLGLAGAFYGVAVGLAQDRPKTVLAYSSISQMGLMTTGVGLALTVPGAGALLLPAIILYALHHALAKGALFLAVGVFERQRSAWVYVFILIPALALAGLPLTSGAVAKTALKLPLADAPAAWVGAIEWLLALAAAGTTLLMAHFIMRLRAARTRDIELPPTMSLSQVSLSFGALMVPWLWAPEMAQAALAPDKWWGLTWPILLGVGLYFGVSRIVTLPRPHWPEGDLWSPLERVMLAAGRRLATTGGHWRGIGSMLWQALSVKGMISWRHGRVRARRAEAWLMRWEHFGAMFVAVIVIVFLVLWLSPQPALAGLA